MNRKERAYLKEEIARLAKAISEILEARAIVDLAEFMYERDLEEMSVAADAGPYLTPLAFQGKGKKGKELMVKRSVAGTGWGHTDKGLNDVRRGADDLEDEE